MQALDVFLKAAQHFDIASAKVKFTLLGAGADEKRLRQLNEELNLSNVQFLPRVSTEEVGKYLNSVDALFVHLKNDPLFEITIPSKILSYLRTGKPILLGLKGDASEVIKKSKSGFLFNAEDVSDLVNKVEKLLHLSSSERALMGENGIKFYNDNLSIESSTDKLEIALQEIIYNNEK